MHLRDRGCVRTLRPLFVYTTASALRFLFRIWRMDVILTRSLYGL